MFWSLSHMDFTPLFAGLGLSDFGVFAMYIVDSDTGYPHASSQFLGVLGGSVVALGLVMFDGRWLRRYTWWLYGAG